MKADMTTPVIDASGTTCPRCGSDSWVGECYDCELSALDFARRIEKRLEHLRRTTRNALGTFIDLAINSDRESRWRPWARGGEPEGERWLEPTRVMGDRYFGDKLLLGIGVRDMPISGRYPEHGLAVIIDAYSIEEEESGRPHMQLHLLHDDALQLAGTIARHASGGQYGVELATQSLDRCPNPNCNQPEWAKWGGTRNDTEEGFSSQDVTCAHCECEYELVHVVRPVEFILKSHPEE